MDRENHINDLNNESIKETYELYGHTEREKSVLIKIKSVCTLSMSYAPYTCLRYNHEKIQDLERVIFTGTKIEIPQDDTPVRNLSAYDIKLPK